MNFNFNSWNLDPASPNFAGRIPFGACPIETEIFFRVYADQNAKVFLRSIFNHSTTITEMTKDPKDPDYRIATLTVPEKPGLLWFDFCIVQETKLFYYRPIHEQWGGQGQLISCGETLPKDLNGTTENAIESFAKTIFKNDPYKIIPAGKWQLTVYENNRMIPNWYRDGIMYQIFPDRYAKGSSWQPKYFPGALVHPNWNDSPHYDRNPNGSITHWDFFGGNLEGITEHLDDLKALNVSIIYLNPIFEARSNHKYDTADYKKISPEFGDDDAFKKLCEEAKKRNIHIILDGVFSHTGDDSLYFNRYNHYDTIGACQDITSPYNWYRFENYPDTYECWWGVTSMPNVEEMNPAYQAYIFKAEDAVIRKWLRLGADGFRLDVADELPDAFITPLKAALLEEKEEAVLIGEVWEDASNKVAYDELRQYFYGNALDGVMNYPFREAMIQFMNGQADSNTISCSLMSLYENYPESNFMSNMNLIGSHDRPRILTLLSGCEAPQDDLAKEQFTLTPEQYDLARSKLKLLSLIQMCFPGVPCIYYGDEAGAQGWEDPYNRGTYPWGREDKALLSHYRKVTALRASSKTLKRGKFIPHFTHNADLFAFKRVYNEETLFCIFNRSVDTTHSFSLNNSPETALDLISKTPYHLHQLILQPLAGLVLKLS